MMYGLKHGFLVFAVAALLGGCATTNQNTASSGGTLLGFQSGPLPPPKAFVVDSRPANFGPYPAVGITPPPRTDVPLTPTQETALENSLKADRGAVAATPTRRKHTGPVSKKIKPLF